MELLAIFILGLIAGAVGAVSSGGGIVSIPFLLFLGYPPIAVVGTTRSGSFFGALGSLYNYQKHGLIHWRYALRLLPVSLMAGLLGPAILIRIDQQLVQTIIGLALIVLGVFLLLTKTYGILPQSRLRRHRVVGAILSFFGMLYAAMFGAGGGAIIINIMIACFGLAVAQATATGMAVWIVGTGVAAVTYAFAGHFLFHMALALVAGSIIGGYFGAHMTVRMQTVWLKRCLGLLVLGSGIKIIFF
jgi:uncharacterized protein